MSESDGIRFLEGGTVTSPRGFVAGATYAGIKTYAEDKLDLGLLMSQYPCSVAAVFTTNKLKSASVILCHERVSKGRVRALVVNSGIANTCVGQQGYKDAQETTALAAKHLDLDPDEVAICSTGVIGVELPMALIRAGIPKIELSPRGGHDLARAILTTDTRPKEAAVSFRQGSRTVNIGGIVKGAGMIHPNMATMLSFITTDAEMEQGLLQRALKEAVDQSFNMVSVDGDTSPNDTVLLLANGAAGAGPIMASTPEYAKFLEALTALTVHLAKEIARDGEGAHRLLEVVVEGAVTLEEARMAARTIVSSNLVKAAVHGADPNWGRVVTALGRSGAEMDADRIDLYINDVCILYQGTPIPFHKDAVVAIMRGPQVSFRVCLNLGQARATAWGCDLSEDYVTINSAYTT